jgi:hypothetical protein
MPKDVFISYATEDKQVANAICSALESKGIQCWIAPRDILPGITYAEALVHAIDESKILVLVFSSTANASPHILREVERATHNNITIIPFSIDNTKPADAMSYYISAPQWLDASKPPLEKHLDQLAATINSHLSKKPGAGAPQSVSPFSPPTSTPERKQEEKVPLPAPPHQLTFQSVGSTPKITSTPPKSGSKTFIIVIAVIIAVVIVLAILGSAMHPNPPVPVPTTPSPTTPSSTLAPTPIPTETGVFMPNATTQSYPMTESLSSTWVNPGDMLVISGTAPPSTQVDITVYPYNNPKEIIFEQ